MKILKSIKKLSLKLRGLSKKIGVALTYYFFSIMAFADSPAPVTPTTDDSTWGNLTSFAGSVQANAGMIYKITIIIATMAGLILIIKGLVHLKQNYTGTGQEKHLSKGIASLGFGTALILAVPISHALVGSMDSSTNFNTGVDSTINFGSSSA